jgi:hypothetical protein
VSAIRARVQVGLPGYRMMHRQPGGSYRIREMTSPASPLANRGCVGVTLPAQTDGNCERF